MDDVGTPIGERPDHAPADAMPAGRCPFTPPRPASLDGQASLLELMRIGLRSAIGIHTEPSYEDTRVGRAVVRTLPKGEKRTLFTVRQPGLVREILARRAEEFPKSQLMDDMLRSLTGYSIFVSNGEAWPSRDAGRGGTTGQRAGAGAASFSSSPLAPSSAIASP